MRRTVPRFQGENFDKNLELVHELEKIAERKKCTPGQVGLAWVRAQSGRDGLPTIVPIPGATTSERIKENMVEISLSEDDLKEIDGLLAGVTIHGGRYAEHASAVLFGDSPEEK
jgi:pyridoxine 4-dehydrogenase